MRIRRFLCVIYLLIFLLLIHKFLEKNSHLIILLLRLEIFILLNLWNIIFLILNNFFGIIFLIIYFTLRVCEACLGLRVLICISRHFGEEFKKNF